MKERSTRALGFALLLLRDVEICAFYELKEKETKKIFDRLIATNHVLVRVFLFAVIMYILSTKLCS